MDIKTLCLGVLTRSEASGYEIHKAFEEGPFAHIHTAGFGSIYPALNGLLRSGLVEARDVEQDKRPDKRLYAITDKGRAAFRESLQRRPAPDKVRSDVFFMLYFAQHLPRAHLARILDQRIAWYQESLERLASCAEQETPPPGAAFVRGLGQAVYRAALDYLVANRDSLLNSATADPTLSKPEAAE
ncbi:MAG TPA: PadR family transcriptional regulator [Kiloniellaceae bacterium]|nr:PadR family transcriptional regulator [Kiloniellaceae bacterium]